MQYIFLTLIFFNAIYSALIFFVTKGDLGYTVSNLIINILAYLILIPLYLTFKKIGKKYPSKNESGKFSQGTKIFAIISLVLLALIFIWYLSL